MIAPSDKSPLDEYVSQVDTTPELLKSLQDLTEKEVKSAEQVASEFVARFKKVYPEADCAALVRDAVAEFDKAEALKLAA